MGFGLSIFGENIITTMTNEDKVLDVREIDPRYRKKTILGLFGQLTDGQCLILISNHSLAPLNKLFQQEHQGFFEWSVLEDGPELWKTSIRKIESLNLTINDIIRQFPLAISALESHGIPYFKIGTSKLSELHADAGKIYDDIKGMHQAPVNLLRTDQWSISFTIDYIINNHHVYLLEMIPELESLIDHLAKAHSATHPQLPMIRERFSEFKAELTEHLRDEEDIVFPSFKKLEESILQGRLEEVSAFSDSINWMEEDHVLTGSSLKSLRNFCNNYVAPEHSSPGFKILFEELKKFEIDMHVHMHLENNVLFSKVVRALQRSGVTRAL